MKSYYKYELARAAGVSPSTFSRWLRQHRDVLQSYGVSPRAKLLNPKAVEWVCREYGIDEPPLS